MQIRKISKQEYETYLNQASDWLYQQHPNSLLANQAHGLEGDLLGFFDQQGNLKAVFKILFFPYKKIFRAAEIYFGPIFDFTQPQIFSDFIESLLAYLKGHKRIIRLRIAPLLERNRYSNDLEKSPNPLADDFERILLDFGFERLALDYDDQAGIQARFFYVKEFFDMSEDQLRKNLSGRCRTDMRKAERFGVKIRFLEPEEVDVFNDMLAATIERTQMPAFAANFLQEEDLLAFGDMTCLPVAYLERQDSIRKLEKEISELSLELAEIGENNQGRRAKARRNEITTALEAAQRRISQVEDFCDEYGDKVDLACAQFFLTKSDCIYLQAAAYDYGFQFAPVYAIHDEMIKRAFAKGVKRYNMFAVSNPLETEGEDDSVSEFKQNFQGEFVEFLGTYEKVLALGFLQ